MAMQIILVSILSLAAIFDTKAAPTSSSVKLQGIEQHVQNKTVFKYHIKVNMVNGQTLNERLEINTKAKTELVIVPKHGEAEEVEVLEDYSKNLTAVHIKAKNVCYISKMISPALPDEFKADLENQSIVVDNDTNVNVETTTWKLDAVLTQRFRLGEEMAVICARSSIYWIQKIEGTGSAKQSRGTGRRSAPCMSYQICVFKCRYRIVILSNGTRQLRCIKVLVCRIFVSC